MIQRSLLLAGASVLTMQGPPAFAGDGMLDRASELRAQPYRTQEPAWLVERAENTSLRLSLLTQTRFASSSRKSGFAQNTPFHRWHHCVIAVQLWAQLRLR